MLKLDDAADRPALRRDHPPSGDRATSSRPLSAAVTRRGCSWRRRAIRHADDHGAGDARGLAAARTASSSCCTTSPDLQARRSDPARFRRERLARAADAADGHPRLRRSCSWTPMRQASRAGRFRHHRRHSERMERLVKGPAAARPSRLRGRKPSTSSLRHAKSRRGRDRTTSGRRPSRGQRASRSPSSPAQKAPAGRSAKVPTRSATSSRTRSHTRPSTDHRIDAGRADDQSCALRVRRRSEYSGGGSVQRVFERFYRVDKSRAARFRRHRASDSAIVQAPDRAAPRGSVRAENRPEGGAPRDDRVAALDATAGLTPPVPRPASRSGC